MRLLANITSFASSDVILRGRVHVPRIFEEGDCDEWSAYLGVKGSSKTIHVSLFRDDDIVIGWCGCARFRSSDEPCEHICAGLFYCQDHGYLGGETERPLLDYEPDESEIPDWEEDDDFDLGRDLQEFLSTGGGRMGASLSRSKPSYQPKVRPKVRRLDRRKDEGNDQGSAWKSGLLQLRGRLQSNPARLQATTHERLIYGLELIHQPRTTVRIECFLQRRLKNGEWGIPQAIRSESRLEEYVHEGDDRRIYASLTGAQNEYGSSYNRYGYYDGLRFTLTDDYCDLVLPAILATGRCFVATSRGNLDLARPYRLDDGPAYEFCLDFTRRENDQALVISGRLRREDVSKPLGEEKVVVVGELAFRGEEAVRVRDAGARRWLAAMPSLRSIVAPPSQERELLAELLSLPSPPPLNLPEELKFEEVVVSPQPRLQIGEPNSVYPRAMLPTRLEFDYEGRIFAETDVARGVFQLEHARFLARDAAREATCVQRLEELGVKKTDFQPGWLLEVGHIAKVATALLAEGWRVEAYGKRYRSSGKFDLQVVSGIDWFELRGGADFEGASAHLPALLAALRKGQNTIELSDGTIGMLPAEWLRKYGPLAGMGEANEDHLRFSRAQVGLLDALLAAQPEATCDEVFARARDELQSFQRIEPLEPEGEFLGVLRPYQKEALGWLKFLDRFGFGGCLADDMGLGKTVQVLALLEARRAQREANSPPAPTDGAQATKKAPAKKGHRKGATDAESAEPVSSDEEHRPSLVVVPKSLVFNWKQEVAKFAPKLRVLDHTGITRNKQLEGLENYDLVITTYGTLRNDAPILKDRRFDYCILDEAQTVKNSNTEGAKAVRLLQGRRRLALSGTPIENHLGELWSMFEFLNPGMLGSANMFRLTGPAARNPDPECRALLSKALRPFLLRRTKSQVAKDLPEKLEQTVYCEMAAPQRKLYDELRDHYRAALMARVAKQGMNKAKMHVLEALLRLRQAACHPGLLDKAKTKDTSAKFDVLLPRLEEIIEEGHKVLVFSQFTSLLAILKSRLDKQGVPYAYLDGASRDRQAIVERFRSEDACKLFLISLKAGGLGLNLTSAEYVFLLDPWWNPAVEAQAIDRAHRIGQTRRVFVYRLIARDTVEDKILELQKSKRDLADAIITADNSLIGSLGREDLEMLLS